MTSFINFTAKLLISFVLSCPRVGSRKKGAAYYLIDLHTDLVR